MQIEKIEIEKFRGIREGMVDGLSPLSILVGPNNCGKSAVLEAIFLSWAVGENAGKIPEFLRRRGGPIRHSQRSFMHNGTSPAPAAFTIAIVQDELKIRTSIELAAVGHGESLASARSSGLSEPIVQYNVSQTRSTFDRRGHVDLRLMSDAEGHEATPWIVTGAPLAGFDVSFVDVEAFRTHGQLEECYSRLEKWNALQDVLAALRLSAEDLTDLRILKDNGEFILHLTHARQQPSAADLAGDGFKRFIALGAAILDGEDDVVLLEEPESYLHQNVPYWFGTAVDTPDMNGSGVRGGNGPADGEAGAPSCC